MTCPYCNSKDTLKVVYSYRGHHIRNKQRNEYKKEEANALIKEGTIYRAERPKLVKYDFDGERLTATLYNKFVLIAIHIFIRLVKWLLLI